ncbi:MAG: DMT family transporter [SAR324 cluster bacterium]|nr:DMT family transporter [SAR324 cluster bacterium]
MFVRSYTFMFLEILFWSMNPVANKIALEEIAVPQLVSMRAVFSSIILLVFSFAIGYRYSPKKVGWKPFLLGFLDPGLTSLLFVYSLTVLSAANTILIIALLPFSQSILGRIVFNEKIQPSIWIGGIVAAYGLATFYSIEDFNDRDSLWGNLLMFFCFCLFSVSQLLVKKIMKSEVAAIHVTTSQMISASVFLSLYMVFFGDMTLPFRASSGTLMTLVFLIFSMAFPFFFYNKALRYITVGMASLLLVLIIPFGFIFAAIFLGESITLTKSAGAIMVMIGVVIPHLIVLWKRKFNIV